MTDNIVELKPRESKFRPPSKGTIWRYNNSPLMDRWVFVGVSGTDQTRPHHDGGYINFVFYVPHWVQPSNLAIGDAAETLRGVTAAHFWELVEEGKLIAYEPPVSG